MTAEPGLKALPARRYSGGFEDARPYVVMEKELQIIINGRPLATASITPGMEAEFTAGYLFGQGFIKSPDEIISLSIEKTRALVDLAGFREDKIADRGFRIVSGGGRSTWSSREIPAVVSDLVIKKEAVFLAAKRLFDSAGIYRLTSGVHSAGIFTPDAEPVCTVEDIGRHNCIDKAVGYALFNAVDPAGHFLFSTGRMSEEMTAKLCRAGFPVAATKTAVTDRGLFTAQRAGMTLIGFVRDRGTRINTDMGVRIIKEPVMKIYSGHQRIT